MLDVLITCYKNRQGMINSESVITLQKDNHELTEEQVNDIVKKVLHAYFERPAHFSVTITINPREEPVKAEIKHAPADPGKLTAEQLRALLTDCEIEVLELMAKGLHLNEIGVKLNRDIETMRFHRRNIYQKLNIHRIQIVILVAHQQHWFG